MKYVREFLFVLVEYIGVLIVFILLVKGIIFDEYFFCIGGLGLIGMKFFYEVMKYVDILIMVGIFYLFIGFLFEKVKIIYIDIDFV